MRFLWSLLLLAGAQSVHAQQLVPSQYDFGKQTNWDNPQVVVSYTNQSSKTQQFLPIAYDPGISILIDDMLLEPGQSTQLTFTYYTEHFGKFQMDIPVYISTLAEPLMFKLKGNIKGFHPEALSMCPSFNTTYAARRPEPQDTIIAHITPLLEEEESEDTLAIEEINTLDRPKDEVPDTLSQEAVVVIPKDSAEFTGGKLNPERFSTNHIIFVIDVSASMDKEDKMPLLKLSMLKMLEALRPQDKISIITYASKAEVVVSALSAAERSDLVDRILGLKPAGQSFGVEAMDLAYETALGSFIEGGNNEIILASDGMFNSPRFNKKRMYRQAKRMNRRESLKISTIGFGHSPYALNFLETLAQSADGNYLRIPDSNTAEHLLLDNIMEHSRIY